MYLIPNRKFAFLAQPRTGSVAIGRTIVEKLGGQKVGNHHDTPDEAGVEIDESWVVASAIRNPWDWLRSWWTKGDAYQAMSFNEFVPWFIEKHLYGYVWPHKLFHKYVPLSTHILRYESLQDHFNKALAAAGLPPTELIVANRSKHDSPHYRDLYSDVMSGFVEGYFHHDIIRFGYKF